MLRTTATVGRWSHPLGRLWLICLIIGCASQTTMMRENASTPKTADPVTAGSSLSAVARSNPAEEARLDALWARRTNPSNQGQHDYPIGPGDVLTISAAGVDEIKDLKVRVSTDGTIELPLLGVIQAGGLTEVGLAQELDLKLKNFMYNPQVSVFVDEYRNREVAVVGAVNKPGLVVLDSPGETLLDVLTQAGGLTSTAADDLVLIPGDQRAGGASAGAVALDPDAAARIAGSANALSINLHGTSLSGSGKYMSLPARPGDVMVVPGGGQVMVVGWVHNPGHFDVGSGLTVLGAIGEAGGPMYAADTRGVTLIRSEMDGSKRTISLDLDKISHGVEPDVPVKANDVVDVPYSNLRIGPYVFYSVLTRVGLSGPMIPY